MIIGRNKAKTRAADIIADQCLAGRTRLLNRTITGIYDEALRPLDITAGQLNVMVTVAKMGSVSPKEIALQLNMEKSTVSRNVERMRARGLLTVRSGKSGRDQIVDIARKGNTLLEKAVPLWNNAQKSTKAILGQRGTKSIYTLANSVRARLSRK